MAAPAFAAAGAAAEALGTSIAIPYPTGIIANDLLIIHVVNRELTDITTPSGWSQDATNGELNNVLLRSAWFWKRALGGETGTVTVSKASGAALFYGVMYRFSDVITTGTPYQGLSVVAANSATLTPADVVTTGPDRCIVVLGSLEDDVLGSMANYTGGTVTVFENNEKRTATGTDATLHCATIPR